MVEMSRRFFLKLAGAGTTAVVVDKVLPPLHAEASTELDRSPETSPPVISEKMRANMTPAKDMIVANWSIIFVQTTNPNRQAVESLNSNNVESQQNLPNKLECCIQLDEDDYILVYKMSDDSVRAIVYSSRSKSGQFLDWTQQKLNTVFGNLATESDRRTPMVRFDAAHNLFVMVKRDGSTGIYSYDTNGEFVDFKVTSTDTTHFLHGVDVYGNVIYSSSPTNAPIGYQYSQLYVSDARYFGSEVLVESGNLPNTTRVAMADRGQMAVQYTEARGIEEVRIVRFFKRSRDTYIPDRYLPEITLADSEHLVPSGNYLATYSFGPDRQLHVKTQILPPHDRDFNFSDQVPANVTQVEVLSAMVRTSNSASRDEINVQECIITVTETYDTNKKRVCLYSVKSDSQNHPTDSERKKISDDNVVGERSTQNLPGNAGLTSEVDVMLPRRFKVSLPTIQVSQSQEQSFV